MCAKKKKKKSKKEKKKSVASYLIETVKEHLVEK